MENKPKILIVGAGPTGLTAAIELQRYGFFPRVVDKKSGPTPLSKAVGIAAHSLEILEPSGVAHKLLDRGHKIRELRINDQGKDIGKIRFTSLPHLYNFLLALPQSETEKIMIETFEEKGGAIEFNCEVKSVDLLSGKNRVHFSTGEEERFDIVLGADGAHSKIREQLNLKFEGYDYPTKWSIADIESKSLRRESGCLYFMGGGNIRFFVRIGENRYRIVANEEEALSRVPKELVVDKVHRTGKFVISIRCAESFQKDHCYLAGDAAHVHSPIGARGMNLGIEDGYTFAKCLKTNSLENYTLLRRPIAKRWIKTSERIAKGALAKGKFAPFLRRNGIRLISHFEILQKPLLMRASGLIE